MALAIKVRVAQPEFRFVAVDGTGSPLSHLEKKNVRVFVMYQYLHQQKQPSLKVQPPRIVTQPPSLRPQFSTRPRWRTRKSRVAKQSTDPDRRTHGAVQTLPVEHIDFRKFPLIPHLTELPVDFRDSGTLSLLQYYHHSFWVNSYAANPNGTFMALAKQAPAALHALLTLVAVHRRDSFSWDLTEVYFHHRGLGLRSIARSLEENDRLVLVQNSAAIAVMSTSDIEFGWPLRYLSGHISAMERLVLLLGGIDSLDDDEDAQRVIAWADIFHAAFIMQKPRLLLPAKIAAIEWDELAGTLANFRPKDQPAFDLEHITLAPDLEEIRWQLQLLSRAKSKLIRHRDPWLCRLFSNLLWKLEHMLLSRSIDITTKIGTSHPPPSEVLLGAFGIAAIVLTFSEIRDLVSPVILASLAESIKLFLVEYFWKSRSRVATDSTSEKDSLPERSLNADPTLLVLIWTLFQGWQSTLEGSKERRWYVAHLARICGVSALTTVTEVVSLLGHIVPCQANTPSKVAQLLEDIKNVAGRGSPAQFKRE